MRNVNLIVMGKTGAGKSTLVNSVLGENIAETGIGKAITLENKKYNKNLIAPDGLPMNVSIWDTVGLEIDNVITDKTISEIENHIKEVEKECLINDISVVWFCVNSKLNRFESYELNLIRKLSVEKCIPFLIILTQCLENVKSELEMSINEMLPEIPTFRVLAQDCKTRAGIFEAYGVSDLISNTIGNYPKLKIEIAESKIKAIQEKEEQRIIELKNRGIDCINKYCKKAAKAGWVPALSIPYIHGIRNKMMVELNKIFGLKIGEDRIVAVIVGIVASPLLAIPLLSRITAEAYLSTIGESYLEALVDLTKKHSNCELERDELLVEEIKKILS